MTPYILIVVSLLYTSSYMRGDNHNVQVTMQEFSSVKACRAAASEITRLNNEFGTIRASCTPKDTK